MKNKTTKKNLIDFEFKVKKYYENKEIKLFLILVLPNQATIFFQASPLK